MNYNFKDFLTEKLNIIKANNTYQYLDKEISGDEINLVVFEEQVFAKQRSFAPNTIYVVIKYLQSTIQLYTETTPIQIMITCEQNQMNIAQSIINEFATTYNWRNETIVVDNKNVYVKHQYTSPVALSNFMDVGNGYRSVIYFTGTIFEMVNYIDVDKNKIEIDGATYEIINFNDNYSMVGNTQPVGDQRLATTEKTSATLSLSFDIPMMNNDLIKKVFAIRQGKLNGNTPFVIKVKYNFPDGEGVYGAIDISELQLSYKLISSQIITAPNQVPSLRLGFMR